MKSYLRSNSKSTLNRAIVVASFSAIAAIGFQCSEVHGQMLPRNRVPDGWVEEPEIVYPSVYQRLVQPSPTVQRIYMWPTRASNGHARSSNGHAHCNRCGHHCVCSSNKRVASSQVPKIEWDPLLDRLEVNEEPRAAATGVAPHVRGRNTANEELRESNADRHLATEDERVTARSLPAPTSLPAPAPGDPTPAPVERSFQKVARKVPVPKEQPLAASEQSTIAQDAPVTERSPANRSPISVASVRNRIGNPQPARSPFTEILALQDPISPAPGKLPAEFGLISSQVQQPPSASDRKPESPAAQSPAGPSAKQPAVPPSQPQSVLSDPPSSAQSDAPVINQPVEPLSIQSSVNAAQRRQFDVGLASANTATRSAASRRRLARTPAMFGDFFGPTFIFPIGDPTVIQNSAGPGGGISKISDNNRAATSCRCYFTYNHFHNAIDSTLDVGPDSEFRNADVNRFMLGWERRIFSRDWSVEFRIPFFADLDIDYAGSGSFNAGRVGNLAAILKHEFYRTNNVIMSLGLGCSTPTGDDIVATGNGDVLTIRNDSVHLLPFLAAQRTWDRAFAHAFMQVDVDLNGNRVEAVGFTSDAGRLNDQTLMFMDLGAGYWLYRDPNAKRLTGVAAMLEAHYETALQGADVFVLDAGGGNLTVGNVVNRFDVVNLTTALQADIGSRSSLRVGTVVPLKPQDNRFFDFEFGVQLVLYRN